MGYYSEHLSGERLRRCYELASPRVKRYLDAEIRFVRDRLVSVGSLLELGCGYGRAAIPLGDVAERVVGVDTSAESLELARELADEDGRFRFLEMDATALEFAPGEFDAVVCIQNGVCAFGVDGVVLLREALRVTGPGGVVLFSTYSAAFWPHRLRWFERQADAGLMGAIDRELTRDGTIVCVDGFRAGSLGPEEFVEMGEAAGVSTRLTEVDGSSLFGEWTAPR